MEDAKDEEDAVLHVPKQQTKKKMKKHKKGSVYMMKATAVQEVCNGTMQWRG